MSNEQTHGHTKSHAGGPSITTTDAFPALPPPPRLTSRQSSHPSFGSLTCLDKGDKDALLAPLLEDPHPDHMIMTGNEDVITRRASTLAEHFNNLV
jgi:hypothetical protein